MNYSNKTRDELKAICKERKIEGISGKIKQALIDLIKQSEREPKSPSTNKTKHTSKSKCSICKQEGHNKRSCKTMTTPVSAPKNEAKTDIKATASVKVEPEMNSSIIREDAEKSALTTTDVPLPMGSSKNSQVAKNGFKAEQTICSQEDVKKSFELYFEMEIEEISCIKNRKKSDIKLRFKKGSETTIQNKDGNGGGRGWSVDRRKVDTYNDEQLTTLLKTLCLKQGTDKPVVSADISKQVINKCMLGIEEEYYPKYFTHTKMDKKTGTIILLGICPTDKLMAFLYNEIYHVMVAKRTCVHLSPNFYLQRKGGGKTDHAPDDIQMKFMFTKNVEQLFTPIFTQTMSQ